MSPFEDRILPNNFDKISPNKRQTLKANFDVKSLNDCRKSAKYLTSQNGSGEFGSRIGRRIIYAVKEMQTVLLKILQIFLKPIEKERNAYQLGISLFPVDNFC